jgi:hypothetical protein
MLPHATDPRSLFDFEANPAVSSRGKMNITIGLANETLPQAHVHCCSRRRCSIGRSIVTSIRSILTPQTARVFIILIRHTTILINSRRSLNLIISTRIDPNTNPRHNSISDILAKLHPLHKRIQVRGFLEENRIVGVESEFLLVGVVRRGFFDARDEVLVEENLPDVRGVRGRVAFEESAVGADDG